MIYQTHIHTISSDALLLKKQRKFEGKKICVGCDGSYSWSLVHLPLLSFYLFPLFA